MENSKKIVVLDGYTLCAGELNFDALRAFGDVTVTIARRRQTWRGLSAMRRSF